MRIRPGKDFVLCGDDIQWVVVCQSEQNDHRRDERACAFYLCYAHPSVTLDTKNIDLLISNTPYPVPTKFRVASRRSILLSIAQAIRRLRKLL